MLLNAHYLIAFLAALWAAYTIYNLIPVPAAVDQRALGRVMARPSEEKESLPFWRVWLIPFNQLAKRLPPELIGNTRRQLYWAQFRGKWVGWSSVEFWGLRIAATLTALVLGFFLFGGDLMLALIPPGIVYLFLGMKLNNPADDALELIQRELPEVAQTLNLLISTGKNETEALREVSQGKGIVHRWLRAVLARRPANERLFSDVHQGRDGYMRQEAKRSGSEELIKFVTQMDYFKASGIKAETLLGTLADSVAADYEGKVDQRAEALGDKLVIPMMIFYFIPYIAGLMAPMLFSSLGMTGS